LPTLACAIVLSGYLYLSINAGRPLRIREFARFSATILKSLGHPHEGGASRAISLSREALGSTPSSASVDFDGHSENFPLPKYAIHAERSPGRYHFLAFVSPDEMERYFEQDLPEAGWTSVGQMGAAHLLQNNHASMIIVQRFYLTSDISEFDVAIKNRL